MTMFENWSTQREECVERIFTQNANPDCTCQTAIIGGGLSGILLALRLSRNSRIGETITLFESSPSLGGRLFFSVPQSENTQLSPVKSFLDKLNFARTGMGSGFGFEAIAAEDATAIERHIHSALEEHERSFLDSFLNEAKLDAKNEIPSGTAYFVRKDLIPFTQVMHESSELLTRKEAEILQSLIHTVNSNSAAEKTPLQESTHWKALSNSQKEALTPVLETLATRGILEFSCSTAQHHLQQFVAATKAQPHHSFQRSASLEFACELILRSRGVKILTSTRVSKLTSPAERQFEIHSLNSNSREEHIHKARNVVIAAPLISCISFLPREFLSGAQSKCILKYPPSSLVVAEYFQFAQFQEAEVCEKLQPGDRLLFATDRVQGSLNRAGNLLLTAFLNYEESLQAAAVREAVGRIRRAAARVLKPNSLKSVAGQTLVHMNTGIRERIVLMPVAKQFETPPTPLREVRMGQKGLFCCGDNFTFDLVPWKNIVQSVQEVISHLHKE